MKSILSTKKLSTIQKDQLLQEGLCLVDYDAIAITFLDFKAPKLIIWSGYLKYRLIHNFSKHKNALNV